MATKGNPILGHEVFPFRKRRDFIPKLPLKIKGSVISVLDLLV